MASDRRIYGSGDTRPHKTPRDQKVTYILSRLLIRVMDCFSIHYIRHPSKASGGFVVKTPQANVLAPPL